MICKVGHKCKAFFFQCQTETVRLCFLEVLRTSEDLARNTSGTGRKVLFIHYFIALFSSASSFLQPRKRPLCYIVYLFGLQGYVVSSIYFNLNTFYKHFTLVGPKKNSTHTQKRQKKSRAKLVVLRVCIHIQTYRFSLLVGEKN